MHIWITRRVVDGLITMQNLVAIDEVVSIISSIGLLGAFDWKTPIHTPKIRVVGGYYPLSGLEYQ